MSNIIELEERKCFDFFWKEISHTDEGFGLIRDNNVQRDMSSIASIGFGLAGIVIGCERGYITKKEGEERAIRTLKTMYENAEEEHGFFYHFLLMDTAKRYRKCEASIIDTAILLMGALTVAQYFHGKTEEYFEKIYDIVDWNWYRNPKTNQFYMGYNTEKQEFFGAWDLYAEQFMMYVLGVVSKTHPVDASIFYDCPLHKGGYGPYQEIYHSHSGSLFVYQFSHAFIDFRGKRDKRGIDWFENSVKATLANRQYCIDNPEHKKSLHKNAWGMTACDTPNGYSGAIGCPPGFKNNTTHTANGTVPPCGSIGSIVFTPKESIEAMEYFYQTFPKLWGEYGFYDAYNLDVTPEWYSDRVIGIDKGISLVMIENYRSGLIWQVVGENHYIKRALEKLEIK